MLYINSTKNLQHKITDKLKKNIKIYVIQNILPKIINYRKKYFRNYILNDTTYFKIDLYYFLNLNFYEYNKLHPHSIKNKCIDFIYNLLPETTIINDDKFTELYNNYYNKIGVYHFVNECIDILTVSDLEIYYIYLIKPDNFEFYLNVNILPIFITKHLKLYNNKYTYYKGIKQ